MRILADLKIAQNELIFFYKPINTNDVAPGWAKSHRESLRWPVRDILGAIFDKICNFQQNVWETFSGPETMDLEQDRVGFLVIFWK